MRISTDYADWMERENGWNYFSLVTTTFMMFPLNLTAGSTAVFQSMPSKV